MLRLDLKLWSQENRQTVILPGIMMFYIKQQNAAWIFLTLYCTNLNMAQVQGGFSTVWKHLKVGLDTQILHVMP